MKKEEIVLALQTLLEKKLSESKANFEVLRESLSGESKSTAGDKHETGRAMIQLEMEQIAKQVSDCEKQLADFRTIDFSAKVIVGKGALVKTDSFEFLVSVSAGSLQLGNESIFCLSESAPLLQTAKGKKAGEKFTFNGKTQTIQTIS